MILEFEPGDKVYNPSAKGIGQVQSIIKERWLLILKMLGKK